MPSHGGVWVIALRATWKDWGFAESLFSQAKTFLALAGDGLDDRGRGACVRASIVFFQMAFETYFQQSVRGYIGQHRAAIPIDRLRRLEKGLEGITGVAKAVDE